DTVYFGAWFDWNNNGVFEAGEGLLNYSTSASGNITFTWNNMTVSGPDGRDHSYLRIRVSTKAITTADMVGPMPDGEVEDYYVPFAVPLPLHLLSFNAYQYGNHNELNWKTSEESGMSHFCIERSSDGNNFVE